MDSSDQADDWPPEVFSHVLYWFNGDVVQLNTLELVCQTWRQYVLCYSKSLSFRSPSVRNAKASKILSAVRRYCLAVPQQADSQFGIQEIDFYKQDSVTPSQFNEILSLCGPKLRSLSLSGAERVNTSVIRSVAANCGTSLTRLDLTGCRKLVPDSFEPLFENTELCGSIKSLTLRGCYRCESDEFGEKLSRHFSNLTHLDLRGFSSSSKNFLLNIATNMTKLTTLEIQQSIKLLDRDTITALLTNCAQLEFLNAKQCNGEWPIVAASGIPNNAPNTVQFASVKLRVLELQHFNSLDDTSLISICNMTNHVLQEISISDCKTITDEGLAALTSVKNLRRLECKNLYQITDDPLISIVEQCSFLEILNVEGCTKLTDELTRALCHAPRNSCAKKITINYSQCYGITDESLKLIAEYCTSIRNIGLIGCNKVTTPAVLNLLTARRATLMNVSVLECPLVSFDDVFGLLVTQNPFVNKISINPPDRPIDEELASTLRRLHATITFGPTTPAPLGNAINGAT